MTCLDGEASHPLYCIIPDVEIVVKMAFSSDQVVSTAVFLRYDVVISHSLSIYVYHTND